MCAFVLIWWRFTVCHCVCLVPQLCARFPKMIDKILADSDVESRVMVTPPSELLKLLVLDPIRSLSPVGGPVNVVVLDGIAALEDQVPLLMSGGVCVAACMCVCVCMCRVWAWFAYWVAVCPSSRPGSG